ncbi:hypothetical protein BDV37DRAFT_277048 [Aspergillus pseudonomiae]|uniref:Uncharacterized protein n=1 Tax=Aspergillus pseudonomiae TaxID=1506151 RepID=A0A5N7CSQ3_9EURO|nr:uncharacterized protein BDV37DRAFT_277048 [Aspergillus pseudonomiae]KAE8397272.1 hypothetical protein BDV37DRAFT_277048 [Aspergillus pseudonomiae]
MISKVESTAVRRETHIFDPDGEVNIILQCPEYHFAPWNDHEELPAEEPPTEEPPAEEPPAEEPEHVKTQVFRIQASAKHLILASPVFQEALTEGWKEGFHLLEKGAVEITISGWDLDAFLILMNIFHCRPQNLPRDISLELLAKVAILADYYQCQTLVQYFADRWIKSLRVNLPTTYSRDSMFWVWVSWVFRQSYEFEKCTLLAISQSSNRITNLGLPIPEQDAITLILSSLAKLRDAFLDGSRGCTFECSSLMFGALTKQMHSNGLLCPQPEAPFIGLNYKGLVETARAIKSPKWPSHYRKYGQRTGFIFFPYDFFLYFEIMLS